MQSKNLQKCQIKSKLLHLIDKYKKQSTLFISVAAFFVAMAVIFAFEYLKDSTENYKFQFLIPAFCLSIAITLFRHDWKIRQILSNLLKSQQKIEHSVGLLEASLQIERYGNKEGKVEETFDAVKQALLDTQPTSDSNYATDNNSLLGDVEKLVKTVQNQSKS